MFVPMRVIEGKDSQIMHQSFLELKQELIAKLG